jgi:DNA-binding PadR family transcriptional regulator
VHGYIINKEQFMTTSTQNPESFIPLTPAVFHIMLALADGDKHGYAIMQEVEAISHDQIKMGPGTLYGSIKRMIASRLIEEVDERPDPDLDDQRRRYYRLTGLGIAVLHEEANRLASLLERARTKQVLVYSLPGMRN